MGRLWPWITAQMMLAKARLWCDALEGFFEKKIIYMRVFVFVSMFYIIIFVCFSFAGLIISLVYSLHMYIIVLVSHMKCLCKESNNAIENKHQTKSGNPKQTNLPKQRLECSRREE